jgi:hypothetical protein
MAGQRWDQAERNWADSGGDTTRNTDRPTETQIKKLSRQFSCIGEWEEEEEPFDCNTSQGTNRSESRSDSVALINRINQEDSAWRRWRYSMRQTEPEAHLVECCKTNSCATATNITLFPSDDRQLVVGDEAVTLPETQDTADQFKRFRMNAQNRNLMEMLVGCPVMYNDIPQFSIPMSKAGHIFKVLFIFRPYFCFKNGILPYIS